MKNVNNFRLSGFQLGLRQRSIRISFNIHRPKEIDLIFIKNELKERFFIENKPLNTQIKRKISLNDQLTQEFAWEVIGLTCHLLQEIKIPCFDRGTILDIKTIDNSINIYEILFQFSFIEKYNPSLIGNSFNWAHKVVTQLAIKELDEEFQVDKLLEELEEKFINNNKLKGYGGTSTIPVLKTAYLLDIPFKHLGWGIYQLGWSDKLHISDRSTTELDSAAGSKISQNKFKTASILKQSGIPVPVHYIAASLDVAVKAASSIGYPVVVKPADKDRGEGVTVNINDAKGVVEGFNNASKLSNQILIEKQVPGICYRILVVGEKSPYVVARMPLAVVGNGVNTIGELILKINNKEKRKAKHLRQKELPIDDLAKKTLAVQGFTLESIPDKDIFAKLRPIESTEWGGLPKVFTEITHPENIKIAIASAKILNLYVAGVDFITEDISIPWYENGAVINEINFSPYLGSYYEYQQLGLEYLIKDLFPDGGRIPIEVFIGDGLAWESALKRQREMIEAGICCIVTSHLDTLDKNGPIKIVVDENSLNERCSALLMNRSVSYLLLVVHTDEFLRKGLPIDFVNSVKIINKNLVMMNDHSQPVLADGISRLLKLLTMYTRKG